MRAPGAWGAAFGWQSRIEHRFAAYYMRRLTDSGTELGLQLRVLLADEDRRALDRMVPLIAELGHDVIAEAIEPIEAVQAITREDPDLSMVLVHTDDEHALDLIEEIASYSRGPVIALLAAHDGEFVAAAADAGVDAYARPASAEEVQSAIEVAMRRHDKERELRQQVEHLQTALERRIVIERAKGILMERHGLDDRAAFERLRATARSGNQTVLAVAEAVTAGADLG